MEFHIIGLKISYFGLNVSIDEIVVLNSSRGPFLGCSKPNEKYAVATIAVSTAAITKSLRVKGILFCSLDSPLKKYMPTKTIDSSQSMVTIG